MADLQNLNLEDSLKISTDNQNVAFGLFNKLEDQYQTKLDHLGAQQTLLKNYQEISLFDKDRINRANRVDQEDGLHTMGRLLTMNENESRSRGGYYWYLKFILLILSIICIVLLILKMR